MKLVSHRWSHQIEFSDYIVNTLIIENPLVLRNYLSSLVSAIEKSDDSNFCMTEDGISTISVEDNLFYIPNVLNLDFSLKKINSALTNQIKAIIQRQYSEKIQNLWRQFLDLSFQVEQSLPLAVKRKEEYLISDYIKIMDFKCISRGNLLGEQLVDYLNVIHSLCGISCFVLFNIFPFFTLNELSDVIRTCNLEGHKLLLIESREPKYTLKYEKRTIIDEDLCEIY